MELPKPEEYNVVHLGPEASSAMDSAIVKKARGSRLMIWIASIAVLSFLGAVLGSTLSVKRDLAHHKLMINTLIDDLGSVKHENILLLEDFLDQELVLQGLESGFTDLLALLEEGGTYDELRGLFTQVSEEDASSVLQKVATADESVVLSSVASDEHLRSILILGSNGMHTDSIILAVVNEQEETITFVSYPRDLVVNGWRINVFYSRYGVEQLTRIIEQLSGVHVDYYLEADLDGFVSIIDALGGVEIEVTEAISDYSYPDDSYGYDPLVLSVGTHHMDGETALKYARTRKTDSDFHRSERQREILEAVSHKLEQLDLIMDMKEVAQLFQTVLTYTDTDLDVFEAITSYLDYQDYEFQEFGFTSSNYLRSMINENGAYILLGDSDQMRSVVTELVNP